MRRKAKVWLLVFAFAGMPLVTSATCYQGGRTIDFYRDDDRHDDDVWDVIFDPFHSHDHWDDWDDDCFFCF
jgi:hypothetical protein